MSWSDAITGSDFMKNTMEGNNDDFEQLKKHKQL